jgi:hypothetical protein
VFDISFVGGVPMNTMTDPHSALPSLAVTSDGEPFVAYDAGDSTQLAWRAAGGDGGSVWISVKVATGNAVATSTGSVALTSKGEPRVVYYQGYQTGSLHYYQWTGNLNDQPHDEAIADAKVADFFALRLDSHDEPHVLVEGLAGVSRRESVIFYRRGAAGWTSRNAQDGALDTGTNGRLSFAIDQADNEAVLIESLQGLELVHGSATATSYEPVPTGPVSPALRPGLAVDSLGGIHGVYLASLMGVYQLEGKPGGPWVNRQIDNTRRWNNTEPRLISFARHTNGDLHLAYIAGYPPDPTTLVYGYSDGCQWTFQTVTSLASSPSIAVDAAGRPHIAFEDRMHAAVSYARAEALTP